MINITKYKRIGSSGLFARCKKCHVWIPKGTMRNHWKEDCDGEEGRKEREEDARIICNAVNKVLEEIGW